MKKISFLTFLLLSVLILTAQRCGQEENHMPDSFYGSWIHSHEEDYDGKQVFRRSSFAFPPSRGREQFDLQPKGVILYYGIAPNDGTADPVEGSWEIPSERAMEVSLPQGEGFAAELVEISSDRLVIQKLPGRF